MFKKGDKVILIDIDGLDKDDWTVELYGQYEIEEYATYLNQNDGKERSVTIVKNISGAFHSNRFITLTQFRKQKIKKLLSKYG